MKTYPLSQSQLDVYLEYIQHPESIEYNLPCLFHLSGNIDTKKLQCAIESVIETYAIFKTRVITQNGELRQYSDDSLLVDIPVVHIQEGEVEQQITQFIRPFDLQKDALFRFLLIETPVSLYFIFDVYHIITDGLSLEKTIDYINLAYKGYALPEEQMSLYDYALQEEQSFETFAYEQAATYYKEKFEGVEMTKLSQSNDNLGCVIKKTTFVAKQSVDDFCTQQGITPNLLFMSAFEIVLSRITREYRVAYSTINHGRNDRKLRNTLGMFVKTVPILIQIDETSSVIDFIKLHKQELMSTIHHGIYPFTHFCQQLKLKPELEFRFQGSAITENIHFLGENIKLEQLVAFGLSAEEPSIVIYETNTEYEIRLEYVDGQYEDCYMQRFADAIVTCIGQVIAYPDKLLKDVSIVSESEQ